MQCFSIINGALRLSLCHRPIYHISALAGWLDSPSAFVYFKKRYHIFYQYHPYIGAWGTMQWGHIISDDLINWHHYPPALVPKEFYDKYGCLAGSAIVRNGYLTLFYTGNGQYQNKTRQSQNMAVSVDGIIFQKYIYNPILKDAPHGSADFRNPKVWRFRDIYYLAVGSTTTEGRGDLLLYTSTNFFHWDFNGTMARSLGDMGYFWENPEIFELDGQYVLILSVQGVRKEDKRFRNLHQTGYFVGGFNYILAKFENIEVSTATFHELDHGHDFYGVKTILHRDGRRLLVGWLGMCQTDLKESKGGWAGFLSIVREIRLSYHGQILMKPLKELMHMRSELLEMAWYNPGESFHAGTMYFELLLNASANHDTELSFEWDHEKKFIINYRADRSEVSINRGGFDGIRRADWSPERRVFWQIFVDASSVEIFCGDGEVVFSSRFYPKNNMIIRVGGESQVHILQYRMRRGVGFDKHVREHVKEAYVTWLKNRKNKVDLFEL